MPSSCASAASAAASGPLPAIERRAAGQAAHSRAKARSAVSLP